MRLTRDNFWLFLYIHALISISQVPIERDNNIALNVRSWCATSTKKEPFMAMLSPYRGTCLITDLEKICVPLLKATLLRCTNFPRRLYSLIGIELVQLNVTLVQHE